MAYTDFEVASLSRYRNISCRVKFKTGAHDYDYDIVPFRDGFSSSGWDLLWSTYVPNLKSLTSPAMKIRIAMQNVQNGVV